MKKGSVTIFFSLILVSVLLLLFALLESARLMGVRADSRLLERAVTESVCAEYDRALFEQYGLLFLDGSYGTAEFSTAKIEQRLNLMLNANIQQGTIEFFPLILQNVLVEKYELATDSHGRAYYEMACNYEKMKIGETALQDFKAWVKDGDKIDSRNLENVLEEAQAALGSSEQFQEEAQATGSQVNQMQNDTGENLKEEQSESLFSYLKTLQTKGILQLVVDRDKSVSDKTISGCLSERVNQNCGNMEKDAVYDSAGRLLFVSYLAEKFGSYRTAHENAVLDYELEYILAGKSSDLENLKAVVKKLVVFRQKCNFAYLMTDEMKKQEALSAATALAGVSANPALIKAVQLGILAGWSYAEGILDVRGLLRGQSVPMMKSKEQWISQLGSLKTIIEEDTYTKGSQDGLDYEAYLKILLSLQKEEEKIIRSMDLIEKNMQQVSQHENFRLDHCVTAFECRFFWQSEMVFLKPFFRRADSYRFEDVNYYTYQ